MMAFDGLLPRRIGVINAAGSPWMAQLICTVLIQVSIPKAGTTVTDPKLRDVDLIQWVADFLSAMFNLDKVDVRGGHTKEEQPAAGSRSVVSFLEGDRPRR